MSLGKVLHGLGIMDHRVWYYREENGIPVYREITDGPNKGSIGRCIGESKAGNPILEFDKPKKKVTTIYGSMPLLKENVKTKFKFTKPKPKPEEIFEQPVDMLGADIKVGDIVNFQATHPRPGGCDYFTALGTVSSISKTGKTIKAKLFYGWKSYLGVDKQVNPDRVMIVSDDGFKQRLMLLKLKG